MDVAAKLSKISVLVELIIKIVVNFEQNLFCEKRQVNFAIANSRSLSCMQY